MSDERYEGPPKSHMQVWAEQALRQQEELLELAMRKARREQMERDIHAVCFFCRTGREPERNALGDWTHGLGQFECKANAIRKACAEKDLTGKQTQITGGQNHE